MNSLKRLLHPLHKKYIDALFKFRNSPEQIKNYCEEAAKRNHVAPEIHPQDFIFHYTVRHPNFKNAQHAVDYYFDDGAQSAEKLREIIYEIRGSKEPFQLLEFASGYGCVTRHFPNFFKKDSYTSCDIHPDAVGFIKNKLKSPAILSHSEPERLLLPQKYDVIFALSFFTHMPKTTWSRWLKSLAKNLTENGCLIFTTHGLKSTQFFNKPELDLDGFYFVPQSEQDDLSKQEYGNTLVHPRFVYKECGAAGFENVIFQEGFWWGHQDLYIIKKARIANQVSLNA